MEYCESERSEIAYQILKTLPASRISYSFWRLNIQMKQDPLSTLTYDIVLKVCGYLLPNDLANISRLSKRWNVLANDNLLWKSLFYSNKWTVSNLYQFNINHNVFFYTPNTLDYTKPEILKTANDQVNNRLSEEIDELGLDMEWSLPASLAIDVLQNENSSISPSPIDMSAISFSPGTSLGSTNIGSMNFQADLPSYQLPSFVETDNTGEFNLISDDLLNETSAVAEMLDFAVTSNDHSPIQQSSTHDKEIKVNDTISTKHSNEVDHWKYIYFQRYKLEFNWRYGVYSVIDLISHDEAIYCVQFDDSKIISGSRDNTIKYWDLETGKCQRTFQGHLGSVLCLQYDSSVLVTGSSDSTIIVWDLFTGTLNRKLIGHTDSVLQLQFDKDILVSCSRDKTVKIWSISTGNLLKTLRGHQAAVNAVRFANGMIVSGSGDRTLKVWNFKTGDLIRNIEGHSRGIVCLAFDGTTVYSGSSDTTIKVWNVFSGTLIHTLTAHTELIRTIQFNSRYIISGSYDNSIIIWDIDTGEVLHKLTRHESRVLNLQFNDTKIVSCSQDHHLLIWDFTVGLTHPEYFLHKDKCNR
ncbi:WD40-repeat-containing domain protein [Globomyces pollinis-pini]|nr:WD40-repeat-containing domain protein [Globomyces pollinis-pini]